MIEDADKLRVTLNDGRSFEASVVGRDEATDLAVLKIDAEERLPSVGFGDSDRMEVGEWVIAVGSPFGVARTARGLARIDGAGHVAWTTPLELGRSVAEPIIRDGRVVVASLDGRVLALDAEDGEVLWSYRATPGSLVLAAPAVGDDGTVYVADVDGTLTALRPPGGAR